MENSEELLHDSSLENVKIKKPEPETDSSARQMSKPKFHPQQRRSSSIRHLTPTQHGMRISRLSKNPSRPDHAQDILDNVLNRIHTLRDNPDILAGNPDLGALTSDPEDYKFNEDVLYDPYDEAAQQINDDLEELEVTVTQKELKIKELEEQLVVQKFDAQSKEQKLRLELEQVTVSEKMRRESVALLEDKLTDKNKTLIKLEELLRKAKAKNVELQEQIQKLELEKKSQQDRLRIAEQDKEHIDEVFKSTQGIMQIELDALQGKLKNQLKKLHQEEENSNTIRAQLRTKSLDVEWLSTEKTNMQNKIVDLEKRLESSKNGEKELDELNDTKRKLRFEVEELRNTNDSLKQSLKMEKQLVADLEKRIAKMESAHMSDEKMIHSSTSKNLVNKYENMDNRLQIERLEGQVSKLKEDLVTSEENIQSLRERLQAAEESALKSRLEKDETILAMKRAQSSKQLEVEENKNSELKEQKKLLQQAEAANTLLEAKLSAIRTQLSVLENAKAKTLEIQKGTINSLEKMLQETQEKLRDTRESLGKQTEFAERMRMESRHLEEEKARMDVRLKARDKELKQKALLREDLKNVECKLRELTTQKTLIELEKNQLQTKLQSLEEQVTLMKEQRVQSMRIQRETIDQLEKHEKDTSKRNQKLQESNKEFETKIRVLEGEKLHAKHKLELSELKLDEGNEGGSSSEKKNSEPTSVLADEASEANKKMFESEKETSAKLTEAVNDLKQKNKEGGKALKVLLKRKKQLETQLKRMHILCEQMAKIQQKIVRVLERELETWQRRSTDNLSPGGRNKVDSETKKLKKRLETEKKLLRELYVEGKHRTRKKSKKTGTSGRKKSTQSKSSHYKSRSAIKHSLVDDNFETQSQATCPPWIERSVYNRQSKSFCTHCHTLNTVDYDLSNGGSFHVNCWQCGGLFHVPGENFPKESFSPHSIPTVVSSQYENQNSVFTFDLPHLPHPTLPYNAEAVAEVSRPYTKVRVIGLPTSMAEELVNVICNIVFYGYELQNKERGSDGALNVSLQKPITSKELSEIQAAMKALREAMQKKDTYNGDMDQVSIEGVKSKEELHRENSDNLYNSVDMSKPTIGALTSPNLEIHASQFYRGRKASTVSAKDQNLFERSNYI